MWDICLYWLGGNGFRVIFMRAGWKHPAAWIS